MKTGGRLVKHAHYYWLLLAAGHLTRRLVGGMLRRMTRCRCRLGKDGSQSKSVEIERKTERCWEKSLHSEAIGNSSMPRQVKSGLFLGVGSRRDEKSSEAEAI